MTEKILSAFQQMLHRAQTYQQKQGGDTAEPLTGNYRDGFSAHTNLRKLSAQNEKKKKLKVQQTSTSL